MPMRSVSTILESLVREELSRILASPEFVNSPYVRDFLRFIVETSLEGNASHLKESVIGVHVFGRSIGYDPKLDPAVRMGAQRLRRKLDAYYETFPGQTLRIVLPKGSYVPQFVPIEQPLDEGASGHDEAGEPSIAEPPMAGSEPPDREGGDAPPTAARRRLGWMAAAVLATCVLALYPVAKWLIASGADWLKKDYNQVSPFTAFPFDEYDATFSPDGSEVVYSWTGPREENIDLYIQRIDEASPHRLTTDPGRDEFASWSPDGRWIAFRRNLRNVMIVSPLGGNERSLGLADAEFVSWVPDGSAVIVPKQHPGLDQYDLETISLATGERRTVNLAGQPVDGSEPFRFSPDGRYFAYCARSAPGRENEIYMRAVEGGAPIQITHTGRVIQGWTWTPDSREIIFSSNISGPIALWRIRAAPDAKPELISGTGQDALYPVAATYAPSHLERAATVLIYERWQRVLNLEQRDIVTERGGAARRAGSAHVLFQSTRDDNSPQISPDGKALVFISNRSGFDEIWKGELDQSQAPQKLTSLGQAGLYPHFPHWSPDGQSIVFSASMASPRSAPGFDLADIYVLRADGSGQMRRLTAWNSEQSHATWSHDGRWIYFVSNRSGRFEMWKLPSNAPAARNQADNAGAAIQLTHRGATAVQESWDGETIFFKKDAWSNGPIWGQSAIADLDSAELIVPAQTREWWTAARGGLFYVDTSKSGFEAFPSVAPKSIYFFDWRTRRSSKIGEIRARFFAFRPDFCASPDGKAIVDSEFVIKNIDLMVVRNFH